MAASLFVARLAGLATIQDAGRPGHMHEGVPPGGALVPSLLFRANRAAGNARDAAAIELAGSLTLTARGAALRVATEDGAVHDLAENATLTIPSRRDLRVRYVALRGTLDAPRILGSRSTLLVAGIGRILKKGDAIAVTETESDSETESESESETETDSDSDSDSDSVLLLPGPDLPRFSPTALDVLLSSTFTISPASDRTGTRLVGPALPRSDADDARSAPMVRGAIEVPAAGAPIVLGPDHPTTGGYPVIAVIARADLDRFHALPFGAPVRFRAAHSQIPGVPRGA